MNKPANSRTSWWWIQKTVAALGTLALAGWLWCFIKAATMDTAVLSMSVVSPQGVAATPREIGGGEKPKEADAAKSVPVPTIHAQAGHDYKLEVLTAPAFDALPPAVARRMEWGCFMLGGDGKWWSVPIAKGTGRKTFCVLRAREPGVYMVLAALPPVTLERLGGRPSSYAQGFLASDMPSRRCRAIQIVVDGNPASNAAQPVPPESVGAIVAGTPVSIAAHLDPPESAGAIVELRSPTDGGPPPSPPQPPEPPPRPEKEAESVKTNDLQQATEQPAPPSTAKDMDHEGTDPQGAVKTQEPKLDPTGAKQPESHVARVPPSAPSVAILVVSNATLPETTLKYSRDELAQLNPQEWHSICQSHAMPFVAVPDEDYLAEYDSKWLVMTPDSKWKLTAPDDVEAAFGLKFLHLSAFNEDVQADVRTRFDDAVGWFKCREQRGFLLNNLLLDAVNAALRKESVPVEDAKRIRRLSVSLSVERKDGPSRFVATVLSVEMKE